MGLFDKLKSVSRMVTGGGAKVYVEVPAASIGEPFEVKVRATVSDASLKIDGVYLLIEAHEEVRVSANAAERSIREAIEDFTSDGKLDGIKDSECTCQLKVQVSGPEELSANQQCEWETVVTLPPGSAPSFRGRNCDHVWRIQAGLDAFGNDPDSGWVEFQVR